MAQPSLKRGWISPAIPVFLLDRFPLDPWRRLSDEYIRLGWQRPWQNYPPECTLWHWRWPPGTEILPASMDNLPDPIPSELQSASPGVSPEFLGALRIKNEAAHIRQVIESILPLCQLIYILDDHSTDNTLEICRSFGEKVIVIPSPFEGLDEARDKNFLLSKIFPTGADWVLWIDGDEVLERNGPARLKQAVNAHPQAASFGLKIVYFWNDEQHVRVDGVYGRFWRQSLFRLKGQPASALSFQPTGYGGNFHCGNIPAGLTGRSLNLDVRLKHYGYVSREQRMAKYDWYRKMDPNNQLEDEYRHLAEIPGAKHAPGPSVLKEWRE